MKKVLVLLILAAGVALPWACSDNKTPSSPGSAPTSSGPTNTPTGTITANTPTFTGTLPTSTFTPTATPTGIINTNTPTAIATTTWTPHVPPPYVNNYGTSTLPNGIYYDGSATIYVAEAGNSGGTIISALERYTNLGGGALAFQDTGNCIIVGQATACPTYNAAPTPYTETCNTASFPMGLATSNNSYELLDANGSGATLYTNNQNVWCSPSPRGVYGPFSNNTAGYGGAFFTNPRCLTADSSSHFYVADTGSKYVDEFDGGGALILPSGPAILHRFNGAGTGYPNPTFVKPVAVACDSGNNVYVADAGPFVNAGVTTSVVQVYRSGGTSIIGSFYLIPGCVANGLAVDNAGDFFVSDTNNGEIEEYKMIYNNGTAWTCCTPPTPSNTVLAQVGLVTSWGDPHSPYEFQSFAPSCMQSLIGGGTTFVVVGDTNNNGQLDVFGPLN